MGLTDFVYRRGASYIWRRRLPRLLGGALIQVSLRTNDPLIARRIAAIVTVASNNLFERMTNTGLSRENARKLLDQVIREEIDRIQARKTVELDASADDAWKDNKSHDRMAARAYRLLAERGRSASLGPEEIDAIRADGAGEDDLERLSGYLDLFGRDYWSEGRMARIKTQLREMLGIDPASAFAMAQGRQIMLRGRAAATGYGPRRLRTFTSLTGRKSRIASWRSMRRMWSRGRQSLMCPITDFFSSQRATRRPCI